MSDPAMELVSTISAGSSSAVTFGITPHQASDLTFNVTYQNGDNDHFTDVTSADYDRGGQDRSRTGPQRCCPHDDQVQITISPVTSPMPEFPMQKASSLMSGLLQKAQEPTRYMPLAVSPLTIPVRFELTFTSSDLSAVPVVISWKDANGDDYSLTKTLDLSSSISDFGKFNRRQQFKDFNRFHHG